MHLIEKAKFDIIVQYNGLGRMKISISLDSLAERWSILLDGSQPSSKSIIYIQYFLLECENSLIITTVNKLFAA